MRRLAKSSGDDFRIKAYAGTNGVLLAMDLDESRRAGLLGFAIQKKEGTKQPLWLLNNLTFEGKAHTLPKFGATPSNLAPLQKFRWADYSIDAGTTCTYTVHPAYGDPDAPELDDPLEVTVKTDDGEPDGHQVIFNRAVAASQAFGRKFPEVDALLSKDKQLPIEKWPAKARDWLHNGLLDRILKMIARAKDASWALDVAIYEYELSSIVDAINAAHKRGVNVRVLYHAKAGDEQTGENVHSLKKLPKASKRARVTTKIFHNKFIVLSKVGASGARTPVSVLCGSTNFTENGVYRQANVVHISDDKALASSYAAIFEVIWNDPDDVGTAKKWITTNNVLDDSVPLFAGFSPRSKRTDLDAFIDIIKGARQDLLFATAFALPDDILDALIGPPNDPILRFGIQNTASRITGYHADRTAEFTTPALLTKGLEGWVKEGLRGQRGNLLIHTKAIVADFTSDDPVVLSGSHNLSGSASSGNDENYLIMRGDTDLADRYGIEVLRFYEHYRFRYYARLLRLKQAKPLAPDNAWTKPYYTKHDLKHTSRLRFAGRT